MPSTDQSFPAFMCDSSLDDQKLLPFPRFHPKIWGIKRSRKSRKTTSSNHYSPLSPDSKIRVSVSSGPLTCRAASVISDHQKQIENCENEETARKTNLIYSCAAKESEMSFVIPVVEVEKTQVESRKSCRSIGERVEYVLSRQKTSS